MFCQSCGAQMSGAFCTKCGARAAQSGAPAQPPTQPPPPQPQPQYTPPPPQYTPPPPQYNPPPQAYSSQPLPPASKGSGLKILIVVLVVLGGMGMLAVGGVWYAFHKVKQVAASKGVDFDDFTSSRTTTGRRVDACALLTKEDLSQIVGLAIDRAQGNGKATHSTCQYFSTAAVDKAPETTDEVFRKMRESQHPGNTSADQKEMMDQLGKVMRGIGAAGSNGQIVSVEIETQTARANMAAFKIAMGAMTMGVQKDQIPGLREDIKGLGDEAIVGPMASIFMVRKGDIAIFIDGRGLTGGRDAEVNIAKHILGNL